VFSLVAFAALMSTLMRYDQTRSWRTLVPAPVAMLAWANLHGGFLVGLVPLGAWGLKALLDRDIPVPQRVAAAVVLASAAPATLINPYGIDLWTFLWSTVGLGRADISEWWSVTQSGAGVLFFWLVTAALAVFVAVRSPERPAWHRVLLIAGLGFASFRVSRLDAFFAVAMVMVFGRSFGALVASRAPRLAVYGRLTTASSTAVLLAALVGASVSLLKASPNDGCRDLPSWLPDQRSVGFVADNRLEGRMLVFFNWGEFVIWHFAPGLQVSTDGRRETVYSDRHIQGHLEVYKGSAAGLAYLHQLDPDWIWLPRSAAVVTQVERDGWTRIYEGERSVVLARRDRAAAQQFVQPGNPCVGSASAADSPIARGLWRY
jgi:hypothetical protein